MTSAQGWTFEDHENGVVYVRAPSGKHVAIGYLAPGHKDCTDILRELIIAHLQDAFATPLAHGEGELLAKAAKAMKLCLSALQECEAILGGEYGDQFGPLAETMAKLYVHYRELPDEIARALSHPQPATPADSGSEKP